MKMAEKRKAKEKKVKEKIIPVEVVELPPKKDFRLRTLSTTYILDERTKELVPMGKMPTTGLTSEELFLFTGGKAALAQASRAHVSLKYIPSTYSLSDKAKGSTPRMIKPEENLELTKEESVCCLSDVSKEATFLEIDEEKSNLRAVAKRMKKLVMLVGLKSEMWMPEHENTFDVFLTTPTQMFLLVYYVAGPELTVSFEPPNQPVGEIFYFIKSPTMETITLETFSKVMNWGNMKANLIVSLLRHMHQIFVPIIMRNKTWPESIKNDFIGQLYRFMAGLTDIRHKLKGKTTFYVPPNLEYLLPHLAARDKDLVQRLEGCLVYWIKQMKELIVSESLDVGEKAGPLTEIDFWQCRCDDLTGVVSQFNKPNIKHFVLIMELANSSYLPTFQKLSRQIEHNSAEARSNHQFLLLLQEPCQIMSNSAPSGIPPLLPLLINTIRFIWVNSTYYNTRDKITGLFRKLSRAHQRFSTSGWVLDATGIFAQVDAFIQRCQDLLNICDCQIHFGRREYGERVPLPACFSGRKKHLLIENMLEVEALFKNAIQIIVDVKSHMLDVRSVVWHESYSRFYNAIKDLDVIIQNTISMAFEYIHNHGDAVVIIDSFNHFSHRETIKRTIDKKIVQIYTLLNEELNAVRKDFSQKRWATHLGFPYYAGRAYYAYSLRAHIDVPVKEVLDAWWLPRILISDETITEYGILTGGLNEYAVKMYQEWLNGVDDDPGKRFETPLLFRVHDRYGLIESNFDRYIYKLWQELLFWKHLHFQLHYKANELYENRGPIKATAELVIQVSRDYNTARKSLSREEQLLFSERILYIDKKIQPGLVKITWGNATTAETYVQECKPIIMKFQNVIQTYKSGQLKIGLCCQKISDLKFLKIDNKIVYEETEFVEEQAAFRLEMKEVVKTYQDTIITVALKIYEIFENDEIVVQKEWLRHAQRIDTMFEEALRLSLRRSLKYFLKAVAGEEKVSPMHLFKVKIVLNGSKMATQPTMEKLANIVSSGMLNTCKILEGIPRVSPSISTLIKGTSVDFEDILMQDEESLNIQSSLNNMMTSMIFRLQSYLHTWEPYKDIWEVDKNKFIQRYQTMQPTVATFDADIARYTEVANNVQTQDSIVNLQFCVLDCLPLKIAILEHCSEWQNKFTSLLKELTLTKLHSLYDYVDDCMRRLANPPDTLEHLREQVDLYNSVIRDKDDKQKEFSPLRDQFVILAKYEITVSEEDLKLLENLDIYWTRFLNSLVYTDDMLKKNKEKFKISLLYTVEEMKKEIAQVTHEFERSGPFGSDLTPQAALKALQEFNQNLLTMRGREDEVRKGLTLFSIDQPPFKELILLEKDSVDLKSIWELKIHWEKLWDVNKTIEFPKLVHETLVEQAAELHKTVKRIYRETQEKNWEITTHLLTQVEKYKTILPLILDLRIPAMKARHWDQIKDVVGQVFNETSSDFNLEAMIAMNMDLYVEPIHEISIASVKELQIEEQLNILTKTYATLSFVMGQYKDKTGHYFIRTCEDIFQTLDENQMLLQTIKSSRFMKPFEETCDYWERTLSGIMETLEGFMNVQKLWMYLENIFVTEDIRKQLPSESNRFDRINAKFKEIANLFNKDSNALRASKIPNVTETLTEMIENMEDIQKSLDMYLETKRRVFPRFYFVSSEDMLEILGQSRNPEAIQAHLKKCFDGLYKLKIVKAVYRLEAQGMYSGEGEYVEFHQPTVLIGPVEGWLCDIEVMMQISLRETLNSSRVALRKQLSRRDRWMKDWPGQLCIVSNCIQWTTDCTRTLNHCKEVGDKQPLKMLKKKQVLMLSKFTEAIRGNLPKLQRVKVVAMVTIEVHARDVIEKLIKVNCMDTNAFDWLAQLRFYWENNDCMTRMTSTQFLYRYEYLGCTSRLVITPLTDRHYITMTTALHLHRGGQPQGPAGTGKTETTKDLGKALGVYVIVINCSEGLDYISMGKMFAGVAQSGCWICYDEFNRISIEVLSVVAQQVICILTALTNLQHDVLFQGENIPLMWSCGIFITLNPGYAGRSELPDNLKSMFRPISMIVPDLNLISEITLFGEGFETARVLAKKVTTLFALSNQQLSKQDHYDFALRGLVCVLRYAGVKRRQNPHLPNDEIIILAMTDMNVPKMTAADNPLFIGIINDLFPGVELGQIDNSRMTKGIEAVFAESGYQSTPIAILKIIQLYETKNSRHSTMLVGQTNSGKSVTWRTLQKIYIRFSREGDPAFPSVKRYPLNPKAITIGELYGEFNLSTGEWNDGVLSAIARQICNDESPHHKWILFDSPVDTLWIESMNSLMDDNKVLTLINGDRIAMPETVSLLFETQDLAVASPATTSRCGIVYLDQQNLGWHPFVDSWLAKRKKSYSDELRKLFDQNLQKLLDFKKENCKELIPTSELNTVVSLCRLLDATFTPENKVIAEEEGFSVLARLIFTFACIWSVGASVDYNGRTKIDVFIREQEATIPNKDTVYEYFVDTKLRTWIAWEDRLPKDWKYNPSVPFYKIMVPTVDTLRYNYLVSTYLSMDVPVIIVGLVGTGKTSVAVAVNNTFLAKRYKVLTINLSAQTTSEDVQSIIESKIEKRTKGVFVPFGGKKMITFMDDFNMPVKDLFGSQPPLELIMLWIDYGFWYDRKKQTEKFVKDMILMAAMGPPGGGRSQISKRLLSRFALINMTFPQPSQIRRIFGSMLIQKLNDFDDDVKALTENICQATIETFQIVALRMLPIPAKIHYMFNLRDISKVFQGLLRAHIDAHNSPTNFIRLWTHESFRVFSDRLTDDKDNEMFLSIISEKLVSYFGTPFHNLCPNKHPPIFFDAMNDRLIYQDIRDIKALKDFVEAKLMEYNAVRGQIPMAIVPFQDAVEHMCHIARVIRQPAGSMLLIGYGSSGRQSLSKLAAFICTFSYFQIEVRKSYKRFDFREDLKGVYVNAGLLQQNIAFIFVDTQIVEEGFLEDISNILSSGDVPNMFRSDEIEIIREELLNTAGKELAADDILSAYNFFIDRVRNHLHIILCMSPVGEAFRNRIRMFPAFVNCTTIDWFSEWPEDALLEVAHRFLHGLEVEGGNEMRVCLAAAFSGMQKSVIEYSHKMWNEIKRRNYVTPSNYLELVKGYKKLLASKRREVGDAANKLRNGLFKLDDTRCKVEVMSVELVDAQIKVAEFQKQCDDYLVVIVQQKRETDEQSKSVSAKSQKIGEEESRCKRMALTALADLEAALPSLEEAIKALDALNKKDLTEIKSYGRPPILVERVMEAVMILRNSEPTWAEAKRQLGEANFIKALKEFDKDNISDKILKKIGIYCADPEFQPDTIGKVSAAARSLCMWVRAMELYGKIYRVVLPKKLRLQAAESELEEKQRVLAEAKQNLTTLQRKVEDLKQQYDEKLAMKEQLKSKAEELVMKLERAEKLVEGLSGERGRWEKTVKILDGKLMHILGDCLMAAACVSYMGPFLSSYRDHLEEIWLFAIKNKSIPIDLEFSLSEFLVTPNQIREWNGQGLPSDDFSTVNGIVVSKANRWPLMVDPQRQAHKWIKNMNSDKKLQIIDLKQTDMLLVLERAIRMGWPTLLQNVKEELDPQLTPVLQRSVYVQGGSLYLKLADREIEYNDDFCFYITSKLANPHFSPEISSQVTIVNFAVKEIGLEAQLLGIVVRKEKPEWEITKDNLVKSIASGQIKMIELEDLILRLLNDSTGSLLDDETLVVTLQNSKKTSQEVGDQVQGAMETEVNIDNAREQIDPMYQFSLDAYINLFINSIEKSPKTHVIDDRINNINDFHTFAVYKYTCRGLFERHKLLFSFYMCAKILTAANKLNLEEFNFFYVEVLDRAGQPENPCTPWLSEANWDNITELEKSPNFRGAVQSFEQYPREWYGWYASPEPENAMLPGEWQSTCNELERMMFVRCLRPDRVSACASSFVINNLGPRYVEPPILDLYNVLDDSSCKTPLVFVLSAGVDPTSSLMQLADSKNMMAKFQFLSLGQGQAPAAERMIGFGIDQGLWVFLANCHLSLSWMPSLEKLVDQIQHKTPHPAFRLWLSCSPNPEFPISILQAGIKMTTEPPKGLKSNMQRMYTLVSESNFTLCKRPEKYKKLLFSLCFFHSIILERKKFNQLGWNVMYSFNDSDFEVSENILALYLDEYEETAWDALKYLIAGVMYGGHVTDDWDRRLMLAYISGYFCEEAISVLFYKLSSLNTYIIPRDGSLQSYKDFIKTLPNIDHPEAFGQHANADIAAQILETDKLFTTLIYLQAQVTAGGSGESREDIVMQLAADILSKIPNQIDYDNTVRNFGNESTPYNTVLLQEIQRYNTLLSAITSSLHGLQRGIKGIVVMSADLEEILTSVFDNKVPRNWGMAYLSMKPLGAWTRDLIQKMDQISTWAQTTKPPLLVWLSGFTFPSGYLTAVLQTSARNNNIAIDSLAWEFTVNILDESLISEPLDDGVYIRSLILEGAGWERMNAHLVEASPMQLVTTMPVIIFRPIESKNKKSKGLFVCPTYIYPNRAGIPHRPSYIVAVDLRPGHNTAEHWIKRGVALLLSLAD
uniref:Dynein axonemal heavy chain 2 n=1 Tax=Strigamia maritima TaxID=126957 RepID=T1INB1_STRMM